MRKRRRSLRAYLVEPFQQIRFGLHVALVSIAFAMALSWVVIIAFYEQYQQVVELFQVADSAALLQNDVFYRNGAVIAVTVMLFVGVMLFVVVRRTHRMYGPIVSILRFINELKRENYSVRIHIREKDDFQMLVLRLNELAEVLHTRHGKTTHEAEKPASGLDALDERLRNIEDGVLFVNEPSESTPRAS